jgi:hypothetical protein
MDDDEGHWKTVAVVVATLAGILLMAYVIYRVVFSGGILR